MDIGQICSFASHEGRTGTSQASDPRDPRAFENNRHCIMDSGLGILLESTDGYRCVLWLDKITHLPIGAAGKLHVMS